jgi:hypothetical protein
LAFLLWKALAFPALKTLAKQSTRLLARATTALALLVLSLLRDVSCKKNNNDLLLLY